MVGVLSSEFWTVDLYCHGDDYWTVNLEQGDSNDPTPQKHGRDRMPYREIEQSAYGAPAALCLAFLAAKGGA